MRLTAERLLWIIERLRGIKKRLRLSVECSRDYYTSTWTGEIIWPPIIIVVLRNGLCLLNSSIASVAQTRSTRLSVVAPWIIWIGVKWIKRLIIWIKTKTRISSRVTSISFVISISRIPFITRLGFVMIVMMHFRWFSIKNYTRYFQ